MLTRDLLRCLYHLPASIPCLQLSASDMLVLKDKKEAWNSSKSVFEAELKKPWQTAGGLAAVRQEQPGSHLSARTYFHRLLEAIRMDNSSLVFDAAGMPQRVTRPHPPQLPTFRCSGMCF